MVARRITKCRACGGSDLEDLLDLGQIHLNGFPAPEEPDPPKVPLELILCTKCHLVQLRHTTNPDLLYKNFWYRSGITRTMQEALLDVVEAAQARVSLGRGDTVVDIGSNDGTLLRYWSPDLERIGFDPALNLQAEAQLGGNIIVADYFSKKGFREVTGKKARVVTIIACFYDLDDPNEFCQDVRGILADDGLVMIQMAYLPGMLETNDFTNICHEHLEYYSLTSLESLLDSHGLHVFDVEENDINGGSFRVYASPTLKRPTEALINMRHWERGWGLDKKATYKEFGRRVRDNKGLLHVALEDAPKPIWVLGASTKGNTLLQYYDLKPPFIEGAGERDERKHGLQTVGTRIPIKSEDKFREEAQTGLVLPWHFREEILKREDPWLRGGGSLIFPLPTVQLVRY